MGTEQAEKFIAAHMKDLENEVSELRAFKADRRGEKMGALFIFFGGIVVGFVACYWLPILTHGS